MTDNHGATASTTLSINVTAGATAPAAPSNLTAKAGSGRLLTLSWSDNAANETGFYIERAAKAKTPQFARIATVAADVKTFSRPESSGTWIYRLQAFNGVGVSGYSNQATIRVR